MKKCMNCGAELPEEVSFCPYCTATQVEKRQVAPRWSGSRRRWGAGSILAALLVLALGIWLWQSRSPAEEPAATVQAAEISETPSASVVSTQPEENSPAEAVQEEAPPAEANTQEALTVEEIPAEVTYQDADGEYQVFLCFELGAVSEPQPSWNLTIPEGAMGQMPIFLVVYKDQSRGREEFLEKVSKITVEAVPANGCPAVELSQPYIDYNMPSATQMCDVMFNSTCGTNRILWTLEMKDGQVLELCQTLEVMVPKTMDIYPEDEPMNNAQELQDLLDRLDLIAGHDTIVTIFLPPMTYEGDLQIFSHAVNLVGAVDNDGNLVTTIRGSVRVSTQRPDLVRFADLCIAGSGSGTGLSVSAGTVLEHCTLTGWEIGAVANHGGYISAHYSTFDGNGVGLKFKTGNFGHCDTGFIYNTFTNNGTAVLLEELAGDMELMFDQSLFSGNGVDVDNPAEHPVNLSAAILYNGNPHLVFSWIGQSETSGEITGSPGTVSPVAFYLVDASGSKTNVLYSELTSDNPDVVTVGPDQDQNVTVIHYQGFGTANLTYTAQDGNTYAFPVTVELPTVGFYSGTTPAQSDFLKEFVVTDTSHTFYLVPRSGVYLDRVALEGDFASAATCTVDPSGAYAAIEVTGSFASGGIYGVSFESHDAFGSRHPENASITLINGKPHLGVQSPAFGPGGL